MLPIKSLKKKIMPTDSDELAKILWQCRRGMLELDLILENFVKNYYLKLNEKQKAVFNAMLDYSDQELYNWFLGLEAPIEKSFQEIIHFVNSKYPIKPNNK